MNLPSSTVLVLPTVVSVPELVVPFAVLLLAACHGLFASGKRAAKHAAQLALAMLGAAVVGLATVHLGGAWEIVLLNAGVFKFSLLLDALSSLVLTLVCFLGVVVTRFSVNYLEGDAGQAKFSRWLMATLFSVCLLVVSGNLIQLWLAWAATSLCLHQLLTFYRWRPGAVLAARKKFLISRLGDVCLLLALVLVWMQARSLDLGVLLAKPVVGEWTPWISGLLVAAALIKSAQFPFHSWLPETLETPTPVSALMHAGIINAGGYLVVRLSPLIVQGQGALDALALVGALTALGASLIMMTQTSIKKHLAWSTVAQMGFMMLQCGLGAFSLAVLHLVAHSLYKAHAFLGSGGVVELSKAAWKPTGRPAAHPVVVVAALLTALAIVGAGVLLAGGGYWMDPGKWLLAAVYAMAVAHMLWTLWSSSLRKHLYVPGILAACAATTVCVLLHGAFEHLLAGVVPVYAPHRGLVDYAVLAVVGLLFLGVLLLQSQLAAWAEKPALVRLYVHASNGFYMGTLFRTLLGKPKALTETAASPASC